MDVARWLCGSHGPHKRPGHGCQCELPSLVCNKNAKGKIKNKLLTHMKQISTSRENSPLAICSWVDTTHRTWHTFFGLFVCLVDFESIFGRLCAYPCSVLRKHSWYCLGDIVLGGSNRGLLHASTLALYYLRRPLTSKAVQKE